MEPTLLIMAAGMGSRYGGLKQAEALGPGGQTILDYSVYDAFRSGFGRVVFIIRKDIEKDFRGVVGRKWEKKAPVRYVFQEKNMVPKGFRAPSDRLKPWGTGHAVWSARKAVKEPFAVINADDFYGLDSFRHLGSFLAKSRDLQAPHYALVGYRLLNTLSDFGTVSRGVGKMDRKGFLRKVVECLHIEKSGGKAYDKDRKGPRKPFPAGTLASMNIWGFTPSVFGRLEEGFVSFMREKGKEPKAEFLLPDAVGKLVAAKKATVQVLPTHSKWFGITYPEDKERVAASLRELVRKGEYPEKFV